MTSIESIPEKWAAAWSDNDSAAFANLFAPQAVYTDHAHQLITTKLEDHHRVWRNANPNFKVIVDPSTPIWWARDNADNYGKRASCSFRTINTGTFMESLPRKVASGKNWSFVAMVHLSVEDGLITQLDEFYRDSFDEGVPVEQYLIRCFAVRINQVMVYLRSSSAVQSVHPKHVESNPHEVSVGEKSSVVSEDVDDAPIFNLRALTTACE
ncbi:hypothetical protein COL26b_013788 [Colletotrichum chrysophilum]|uniref:uncharacterized protein n=1 Tax=Colletotrichum chrysophilum TaxID=1836956 RepID=UPI0023015310|nr:uncharacterized protein COL26b_013788 [Colletotrichum chrysophilum]KAJ0361252.1 hypothetical protein COL26b_013788 [Colletotrichum chrysophilum]